MPKLCTLHWWRWRAILAENAEGKADRLRSQPLGDKAHLIVGGKTLGGRPLPGKETRH